MRRKHWVRLEKNSQIWRALIANSVFTDYFYKKGLEETCKSIELYKPVIEKLWEYYVWSDQKEGYEPDLRIGAETYGYESLESIERNLSYISDRFSCPFRLAWLLEVPENVARLKNEHVT